MVDREPFAPGPRAPGRLTALGLAVLLAGGLLAGAGCRRPPRAEPPVPPLDPRSVGTPATPAPPQEPAREPSEHGPEVDVAAFRGLGRLAFVWNGRLYLLDGGAGIARALAEEGQATGPAWSPDGRWLAYLAVTDEAGRSGRLTLVRLEDALTLEVAGLPGPVEPGAFAWSPAGNVLAVAPGGSPDSGGLWLVEPDRGGTARLAAAPDARVWSFAWAPGGDALAYVVTLPFERPETRSDALLTVALDEGTGSQGEAPTEPAARYVAPQSGIELAGWWPDGRGLVFWEIPQHSMSLSADGAPLMTLPLDAGEPTTLARMLTYPEWLSWSPGGDRLLLVSGGGRAAWWPKVLAVCEVAAGTCRDLPQPPGMVSLDPAWSPAGDAIAFVRADLLEELLDGPALDWESSRALWLAAPDGTGAREVEAAGSGVHHPVWSGDGSHLLFVRDEALWLLDVAALRVTRLVGSPAEPARLFRYYGHVAWSGNLAWYSPR